MSRPISERSIFLQAIDFDSKAERAAFLDDVCRDSTGLRAELDALLAAHDRLGDQPPGMTASFAAWDERTTAALDPDTEVGTVLAGRYKLLEPIGEGGFGVVFLAEQTEPIRRKVAVKLLKPGMDSRQVVARFEAERQALAIMDHPNIAKVFDGGVTPSGRSYFVMELVKGVPITDFCDENRLTPRQRLELFVPVCQAVQHAHQKGVIHRDLKPSNVLVCAHDGKPAVKVIDFGIAKATGHQLTDKTLFTGFAQMVGTPLYMSPEQAALSPDVDTRSDVYSLGVLLYELLTGSTPFTKERFKQAAYDEIRRIIREEEPPRPSTRLSDSKDSLPSISALRHTEPAKLSKLVRGEMDWIVMRALEKDRNRRYETANGFAADVQRYLCGEAVHAVPPSVRYRFRKFTRRNRRALVTASVVALAVMLASGIGGWAVWDRAARQATIASRVDQLLDESATLYQQRKLPEATQIARNTLALAEGGAGDSAARRSREWLKDLDMVARLEEIHSDGDGDGHRKLVEYPQAFREYGIEIESLTPEEAAARIAARPVRVDLAVSLDKWVTDVFPYGDQMGLEGEKGLALRARLRQIARLADPDPVRDRLRDGYAEAEKLRDSYAKGEIQPDDSDVRALAASVDLASTPVVTLMLIGDGFLPPAGIPFYTRVQQQYPNDFGVTVQLGRLLRYNGDFDGAIRFLTAAVSIRPQSQFARHSLGIALLQKGRMDEGIAELQASDRLNPLGPRHQLLIGSKLLLQPGREEEAAAEFREALRLTTKPADFHRDLGWIYSEAGKYDDAIKSFRESIRLKPDSADTYRGLGIALEKKGLVDDAIAAHREAVRLKPDESYCYQALGLALGRKGLLEQGLVAQREAVRLSPHWVEFHNDLGISLSKANLHDEAITAFREGVQRKPKDAMLHYNLGVEFWKKGEYDAAIKAFREAIHLKPDLADAHSGLGIALEKKGLVDDAIAAHREAVHLKPDDVNVRIQLGRALRKKGLLLDAIGAHQEAARLKPDDDIAHNELGITLEKKGLVDDAVAAHRVAVRLKPGDFVLHNNLGIALRCQNKLEEAIASHREAVRLKPDDANAYNELGITLERKGLVDDAISAHRVAVRLKPDEPRFHYALGGVHARFGQWAPAAAAYARGLELDKNPNNHGVWYSGLPLQLAAGDSEGFRRLCRQMLERFGQTKSLITAEWTAKTCALVPDAVADFKQVEKLADLIVTGTEKHGSYRFFVLVKALVEYRAGRPAEAVRWADRYAPATGGTEFDAFVFATLSMAHHRLGNADRAQTALANAKSIVTRKMPNPTNGQPFKLWHDWQHVAIVLREAEALAKEK